MSANYLSLLVIDGVNLTVSITIKLERTQHESDSTLVSNVIFTSVSDHPHATSISETSASPHTIISCITPPPNPSESGFFPFGVALVALLAAIILLFSFYSKRHKQQEPQLHEREVAVNAAFGGDDPCSSVVDEKNHSVHNSTSPYEVRSSAAPFTVDAAISPASDTSTSAASGPSVLNDSPAIDDSEVTVNRHSTTGLSSRNLSYASIEDVGSILGGGSDATEEAVLQHVAPELVLLPGRDEQVHPKIAKLVVEGNLTKSAIRKMKPMKPNARLVNEGYNQKLDEVRPQNMKAYLRDYRVLFVIDDSGSMHGTPWTEARDSLSEIAEYALKYHFDTVDIMFLNNSMRQNQVKGIQQVLQIFNHAFPSGGTPLGAVLQRVLQEQINRLDGALHNGNYNTEPPLAIIVITDGVPDPFPTLASVIEYAANQLKSKRHHQNAVGIQFVQIGNDPQAAPTLQSLIHGNNNDMVDTVSYNSYKDEDGGKLTPAVLKRIVLGALHPNLRSYYNRWELNRTGVV